jgi:peroxiredoxin
MRDTTDNLKVGERAPDFTLAAANREGSFSLAGLLADGPLIVEFLRGTW